MAEPVIHAHAGLADTRIYYEIYGSGSPVVLLHGNGEDLHVFDALAARLAERFRVVAIDTRGHGKSGRGEKPFRFETFAEDVADVMKRLRISQAQVVGFSDGASTALYLALHFPERVSGLVLLGANLSPKGVLPRFQLLIRFGYAVCSLLARVDKRAIHNKEQLELMVKHPNLTPEQLRRIHVPALVMAGENDMIRPEHTQAIADAIPGAKKRILPGGDHFTLASDERAIGWICEFLG